MESNELRLGSATLEKYIVAYCIKNKNFFLKVGNYLVTRNAQKNSHFNDSKFQDIINCIGFYDKQYNKFPSKDEFIILLDKRPIDDEFKKTLLATYIELLSLDIDDMSPEMIEKEAVAFIKTFRAIQATNENILDIQGKKYDNLAQRMQEATSINFDKDLGSSIMDTKKSLESIKEINDDTLGISSFPSLDNSVSKLLPGEEWVLCAVPGGGKTLIMGAFAQSALKQGKNVVVFSLEVSEKRLLSRYYQSLLGKTKIQLLDTKPEDIDPIIKSMGGDIRIKSYSSNTTSCNDFRAYLNDLETYENWKPDMIVVDYIGIMAANDKDIKKTDNSYQFCDVVTMELRNLAGDYNVPVLTAAQINRNGQGDQGGSKGLITSKDIAESRAILNNADYLITINQTAKEKYLDKEQTKGLFRLYVDKDRNNGSGTVIPLDIDWKTLVIQEHHGSNGDKK